MTGRLIVADASKVSGKEFFDAVFGSPADREKRDQLRIAQCIAAIERGNTYGWPPSMVDQCRALMADKQLTEVTRDVDPQTGNDRIAA